MPAHDRDHTAHDRDHAAHDRDLKKLAIAFEAGLVTSASRL